MNDSQNQMYRTAIYTRASTDRQETENQLRVLREVCANDPTLELAGEYIDHETGSSSTRSDFRRLFADAHERKFDLVLFWALDRFSREGALATLNHLQELESYGIGFRSHTERYLDSTGLFKDAIIAILATLAKQESIRISERVKAGMDRARAQGKRISRPRIPAEKQQRIRDLAARKVSKSEIARRVGVSRGTVLNYLRR